MTSPSAFLTPSSPASVPKRGLFILIASAVLAIVAVFVVLAFEAGDDARRAAENSEMNLATALARDIDRNIELLDLSIQAARDSWALPGVRLLDPALRQMLVFDHSATAQYIDSILVVDRDGAVLADSRTTMPVRRDFSGADFFRAQMSGDAGLFIGRPMAIPGRAGWHMAFSRRITAEDGGFAGVAVGFLSLDYLSENYRRLALGPGGIITLFNADGTLLVREPEAAQAVGRSFLGQPAFDAMTTSAAGSFEGTSAVDGRRRLYAYHRVGTLPLLQAVGAAAEVVYADWWRKTFVIGTVLSVLCAGIMTLLFVLQRELAQRVAAERALDALASTDHLTGLLNRRKFFELAEARCREAAGRGEGLSLLMIDADHFKSYNDLYGHVAGDSVLAAIGRSIAGELDAGTQIAARYGGEEFVVLLPGLDEARAHAVADAIRAAVARLATPHDRASAGIVTVSTGQATAAPGGAMALRALVEAADAELYRSKRDGRNRSSGGERPMSRMSPLMPSGVPSV